jgi:hypothetical protein
MLLKARWAHLWYNRKLIAPPGQLLPAFETLVEEATARSMLRVLTGEWQELYVGRGKNRRAARLASDVKKLESFWDGCKLDLDTIVTLRNKTIHTYLSVPQSIADAAGDVARRNLDDYREHWAVGLLPTSVITHAMIWRKLCELCGADAFLPPNLLD